MSLKKKTLYHYTSPENAASIRMEGVIYPSKDGVFGGGKVYFTDKNPQVGRKEIARNNYCGGGQQKESQGSVDAVIKARIPEREVTKEPTSDGRSVYTVRGPVYLPDRKK